MPVRQHFSEELDRLQKLIMEMGALVVRALERSVQAYANRDTVLAREIIEQDPGINQSELRIDDTCAVLIAQEQPVARDLRLILNSMRTSHTLERIADNAVHVSKSTLILAEERFKGPLVDIQRIASVTIGMVKDAMDVYASLDTVRAREISVRDREVDSMYAETFKHLLDTMEKNPGMIHYALTLLFICRRLERIADHATHICEGTIYVQNGSYVDLNL
jgi:phosphate transport system protein